MTAPHRSGQRLSTERPCAGLGVWLSLPNPGQTPKMVDEAMSKRRLYMDNAATSFPKPPEVLAAMSHYATCIGASAGRGAYEEAMQSAGVLAECRRRLQRLFNGQSPEHFIFTMNCSDGLNMALKGLVLHQLQRSNDPVHVICSDIDHNSILRPVNAMQDLGWVCQTRLSIDPVTGLLDPDLVRRAIRPNTRFIAATQASNVTGTVQPIREIGKIAREHGIPFVVDAAQSVGHMAIDVQDQYIDLLAAPGHKGLLGPLGTGLLYVRPGIEKIMATLKEGGTGSVSEQDRQPEFMPDKYETGSHNAIGVAGLSAGVQWILDKGIESLAAHDRELVTVFVHAMQDVEGVRYFGPQGLEHRVGVFSVRIDALSPHELAAVLETQYGILTRPGIHCAPRAHEAIGTTAFGGTTRLSFGPFITPADVEYAARSLAEIAQQCAVAR